MPSSDPGVPRIGPNRVAALRLAADSHEVSAQVAVELYVVERLVARMVVDALSGRPLSPVAVSSLLRHATTLLGLAGPGDDRG